MKKLQDINLNTMPVGILAVGIFLACGAIIAALAGLSLLLPDTLFDWVWQINEPAHRSLATDASKYGLMFLGLALVLGAAAWLWLHRKEWGRKLVVIIIGASILTNLVHYMNNRGIEFLLEGLLGVGVFIYLCGPSVRAYFNDATGTGGTKIQTRPRKITRK